MSIEFKLPGLGEGVESADVAELRVKEGDTVEEGQVVAELETEKAVVELPCPHAGKIQELRIKQGDTIKVGDVVMMLDGEAQGDSEKSGDKGESASSGDKSETKSDKPEKRAEKSDDSKSGESQSDEKRAASKSETPSKQSGDKPSGGQRIEFQLPAIGEGVETADVAEVRVSAGDTIEAEQVVMDLETEKAVIELPCPFAGKIEELHVKPGDTVKVGQNLFTLATAVESQSGEKSSKSPQTSKEPEKKSGKSNQEAPAPATAPAARKQSAETNESAPQPATPATTSKSARGSGKESPKHRDDQGKSPPPPASPSTRRLARQLGVDLRDVVGSGPGKRITHEDVQEYVKQRLQQSQLPAVRQPQAPVGGGGLAPPPLPDFTRFGPVEREKLNKLGRVAAENLTVSWHVIPHVTQHDRVDVTDLEAARKRFASGPGQKGPKVTMTAIAIKALATALQSFPKFNSSLDPETFELVLKKYYDIGCAVDTPHGLLVPIVRNVDQKSILTIAAELEDLAGKARERKLPPESMQGATCTVTNLGGIGGTAFTPIVNYPEVCILGLMRAQPELRLINGEIQERLMLPVALSYDHRVINGADAARFVTTLCNMLTDPFHLLSAI